uniref:Uncharacterized protein n=1 Tax=Arundo donax TaxID=35708 RepID=A0A0A9HHB1_ARUDO
MICFGEVARCIVGKLVEALIRSARRGEHIPPDLAAIVSQRFTFGIIMTDQSYDNEDKSYQVTSIMASHGREQTIPRLAALIGPSTSRLHSSQDTTSP